MCHAAPMTRTHRQEVVVLTGLLALSVLLTVMMLLMLWKVHGFVMLIFEIMILAS